jgi:hypothetical protein
MSSHLRRIDGNEARQISRFCTAQLTVTDGVATMQIGGGARLLGGAIRLRRAMTAAWAAGVISALRAGDAAIRPR